MAQVELVMPKMGESIIEATILNWLKSEGDTVELDETILEIATDKVDSEIPSPVEGTIVKILHHEDEVVEIGKPIALIETDADEADSSSVESSSQNDEETPEESGIENVESQVKDTSSDSETSPSEKITSSKDRFYSPLVKNIAAQENISQDELDDIDGSGMNGRVTKSDILSYVETRSDQPASKQPKSKDAPASPEVSKQQKTTSTLEAGEREEIIQMGRMRKMIADHMVRSKHTSPHVTSFVEVDVTNIVEWRNSIKKGFKEKHGEKITYTPIFMESVIKAIHDFPGVNVSVQDDQILQKNYINIGMATALPSGDLIVPVIKDADNLSLLGLTKNVNDLARRARSNNLKADEVSGGTFTVTNVGTFGNVMGTPIINQPQVAILAVGAIRKKPAVVETEYGDVIAIRHMMFLSLSYDHRIVDGMMGGSFLSRIGQYMEDFDPNRTV